MSLKLSPQDYITQSLKYKENNDIYALKSLESKVYTDTVNIANLGCYSINNLTVKLPSPQKMMEDTVFYRNVPDVNNLSANYNTKITVEESDSIAAGKKLSDLGFNPVVLNMASAKRPGGGVLTGSSAQEESLFRRTNLFQSMYQFCDFGYKYNVYPKREQYPIYEAGYGIYTPNAIVFRDDKNNGYALLEKYFPLSFIAVPAINHPQTTPEGTLTKEMEEITLGKMKTILRIALLQKHDAIVLGAWGCGAYKNPPKHIAKLFHQTLLEKEFCNKFKKVVFAIIENKHKAKDPKEGNYSAFRNEFNN